MERIHFQAGIVREEQAGGVAAVVERFDDGVLFESASVFHARSDLVIAGQQFDLYRRQPRRQTEFPQFSGIAGGTLQPDQIAATFFWISMSRAMPARASSMRLAIWASSKAACSAVACTSTNLPAPVITTFMSTSARESSSKCRRSEGTRL